MAIDLSFSETGTGPAVVILHGLFGSKRNWASIARRLGERHRVITVDLRNHGESPWDERHDYPSMAADVARLIETQVGGPASVLGHSMGGKAAMLLALDRPDLVERLVVVDIPPARSSGSLIGAISAMQAVPLGSFQRRTEVEAALERTIPDRAIRSFLVLNLAGGPGGLRWTVHLDALERNMEAILGFPTIPEGRHMSSPSLFLVGERSDYVRPEHHAEIKRLFPAAVIEAIAGAGHWPHADAPGAFLDAVNRFLMA
ncbi:MAG: alpha/beta fold hydrolase [Planctomycetia bacterium]